MVKTMGGLSRRPVSVFPFPEDFVAFIVADVIEPCVY
jgi:hypothetical protein